MTDNKTQELLHGNLTRQFFRYVLPGIGSSVTVFLFGMFDSMFVGQTVGELGLTALNLMTPFFALQAAPALLLGVGGATLGAIATGSGDKEQQNRYFTISVVFILAISAVLAVISCVFTEEISRLLGASDDALSHTMGYLRPIGATSTLFMLSPAVSAYVRNDNDPNLAMISTVCCGLLNILLDYIMVVRWGLGTWGASVATAISMGVGCLILAVHFLRKSNTLRFARVADTLKRLGRTAKCGLPSFVLHLASGLSIYLFNRQLLRYAGDTGVSAFAICSIAQWLTTTFVYGIGDGVQPIISTNFGAGQIGRMEKIRSNAFIFSIIICMVIFLACMLVPERIVLFFVTVEGEQLAMYVRSLRLYSICLPLASVPIIIGCYLQSINLANSSTAIQLGRGLVFIVALLYILPVFLGIDGIMLAAPGAEFLALILSLILARRAGRKLNNPI